MSLSTSFHCRGFTADHNILIHKKKYAVMHLNLTLLLSNCVCVSVFSSFSSLYRIHLYNGWYRQLFGKATLSWRYHCYINHWSTILMNISTPQTKVGELNSVFFRYFCRHSFSMIPYLHYITTEFHTLTNQDAAL